jgi:D-inositol-3-phosphate glycosyltransferase
MSKKIIIIGPAHPLRGGLATFDERLARAFQEHGHQVKIYTFSLQYPDFLFPGKTQLSDEPKPQDIDIEVVINSVNPFNWIKIGRKIAREQADLVICRFWLPFMGPSLGTILRLVKRQEKTRILGLIDNIIPHEKRFGDRPLAQYFVNACDAFVVMSQSVKKEMKTFTRKPCTYIPHPIYDNYGEKVSHTEGVSFLKLPDNRRYILFFGFIRRYKGLDLLLEAFSLFKKQKEAEDVQLIIAGEFYDDAVHYHNLIDNLNLTKDVIVHSDFIPSEDVRYYFAAADIVVQPYRSATQSGISQIAYHFEKPMIVSNVGGLSEIVPHGVAGYVVEPTPQDIADALTDFFKNNKLEILTKGVIEQKKRFSWDAMVEGFLKITPPSV